LKIREEVLILEAILPKARDANDFKSFIAEFEFKLYKFNMSMF